jgi:hypothetical protein
MAKNQDWLAIIDKVSRPKKGTKIPPGVDLYALLEQMSTAGREVVSAPPMGDSMSLAPWNTGAGANGVVEPGRAVTLDNSTTPPSVYHEGETIQPFPGGKKIIPAQTEQQQADLGMMQQEEKLPGYATGGTVYDDPNKIAVNRPTAAFDLSPRTLSYQAGQDAAFKTTQQRAAGTDPIMSNIRNRSLQDYDSRASVNETAARQEIATKSPYLTEGAKNAVLAKEKATYGAGLSDLTGELSQQSMARAEQANTDLFNQGRTGVQDTVSQQQWEKTFGENQYQNDLSQKKWQADFDVAAQKYGDQEFGRMADDAQTTSLSTWLAKYPTATEADYSTAREYKKLQLESAGIANAVASENLTQMKNSAQWSDAQKFLEAGDYTNYAAIVKSVTGRDISTADFKADRDYLNTTRTQATTAADLALQSTKNRVGDEMYNTIQNMIDKGSSLSAINSKLVEQGKSTITQQEFTGMLNASALGDKTWGRNLTAANMLLTTPGAANKEAAAAAYSTLFPGVSFDFSSVITAENTENFSNGMSTLAGYLNADMPTATAVKTLRDSGVLTQMRLSDADATQLYNSMKVNAVDSEWDEMENSDFFQNKLTPDEQTNQREFFKQKMLGNLDYTTLHEYTLTDPANPNSTTPIYAADKAAADKEAAKLGSGYVATDTGKIKFQLTDTLTSATDTTPKEYTGEQWTKTPIKEKWSYFEANNALYPDITTEQEWKDAGMPHPADRIANAIDKIVPKAINKADDMILPGQTPEVNAKFSKLYSDIQKSGNVDSTDMFDSDDMDKYLPAWVELYAGTPIRIGDTSYKVKSYTPSEKAGDRSKLVLEDSKGVQITIEGGLSKEMTSSQAKADANKKFIGNAFALEIPQAVEAIQTGDTGAMADSALNVLTFGGETSTGVNKVGGTIAGALTSGGTSLILQGVNWFRKRG